MLKFKIKHYWLRGEKQNMTAYNMSSDRHLIILLIRVTKVNL